jgi:hypothetical protein
MEVTDETDGDDAGDPEDAIFGDLFAVDRTVLDAGASGRDFGG